VGRYEPMIKYLTLAFILYSGISSACIVGPKNVTPNNDLGFTFKQELSSICSVCNSITIDAPIQFNEKPLSHAIFSVFLDGNLLSKSVSYIKVEPEFYFIVSNNSGITYEINLEYGNSRCMSYVFTYSNITAGS